jgi:hypothetical protein
MPRYYFNLYQGSQLISEDGAGYDCPSDDAARQFARMSHGFVALDPVLSSPSGNYHFVVLNEDRQNIFTIRYRKVSPPQPLHRVSRFCPEGALERA